MQTAPSTTDPVLSEADIQAFVDGLLAPDRAAQIQRYLNERPDEARRVAFYGKLNWQMQSSFQAADNARCTPLQRAALRGASLTGWLRRRARGLAIGLLLTLAAVTGVVWATHVPDAALDALAIMALEQTVAGKDWSDENTRAQALAAAPDLSSVGMHAIVRLTRQVGPFARASGFIYRNTAGEPVVLLTVPDLTAWGQPQWQASRVGSSRVLGWTASGTKYVLAGRADARGLMLAADVMTMR